MALAVKQLTRPHARCFRTRQEGSYLYKIAEKLSNKFEEKYAKIKNEGACTAIAFPSLVACSFCSVRRAVI